MTCASHEWVFTIPCPRCAVAGVSNIGATDGTTLTRDDPPVGYAVYPADVVGEPYVEPPLPAETGDPWEIPAYLRRRQGGGFKYPSLHGEKRATQSGDDSRLASSNRRGMELGNSIALKFWPDDKLLTALSDHTISVSDRQPILEEAKKRHDQVKGYERQRLFLHGAPYVYS